MLPVTTLLLQEVDDLNDESLLIQRVRIACMAVLVPRSLQKAYRREVPRFYRGEEVVRIVLMVRLIVVEPIVRTDEGRRCFGFAVEA